MLEWEDRTAQFSEDERHWNDRYLEVCEVAENDIECNLYSCFDDDWEIYVNYGEMYGISYAPEEKAAAQRAQMMKEIEAEYDKNGKEPSDDFIDSFAEKYKLDIMNTYFNTDDMFFNLMQAFDGLIDE